MPFFFKRDPLPFPMSQFPSSARSREKMSKTQLWAKENWTARKEKEEEEEEE